MTDKPNLEIFDEYGNYNFEELSLHNIDDVIEEVARWTEGGENEVTLDNTQANWRCLFYSEKLLRHLFARKCDLLEEQASSSYTPSPGLW
ncbi:hypothetical protein [Phaeobacter sp. 11ANDIMAR09]|uniref:hypothetical protein n=1 Tax=Phaeobacter sp. 11ANDIMAR09 TaxID=1225647 RepID=UPI0006C87094|nr:hypothetical protein [Phaeobacter sp. 11ANDIMAR09]KPD10370.1 hypothetical protein AN476_21370 [Phaeobacter sp. 11ANDIMAR09]